MKHIALVVLAVTAAAIGLIVIGATGIVPDQKLPAAQRGFLFKSVTVEGKALKYVEYVPRDVDLSGPVPLVVFLHGSGECGGDGQKQMAVGIGTELMWHAERWPCIVLIPQKPVQRAQWEEYDGVVMDMVAQAKRDHAIDAERVSLTGLSQGGHGTWAIGMRHPEVWCALAPICGYADAHGGGITPEQIAAKVKGIPVWCFHGEKDPVVPVSQARAVVDAINGAAGAGAARLTVYPEVGHDSWNKAYAEGELPGFLMMGRKR
jgi:predicted peptidase